VGVAGVHVARMRQGQMQRIARPRGGSGRVREWGRTRYLRAVQASRASMPSSDSVRPPLGMRRRWSVW
jgi:hypothetical protein